MLKPARLLLIFGLLLLAAACTGAPQTVSQADGPLAWIDAPREGSLIPLGPVEVVSHFADLGGINQTEFAVNGQVVTQDAPGEAGQTLVTWHYIWQPSQPGTYVLMVRGQNSKGEWSDYAQVQIEIIGTEEITPTPEVGASPTPPPIATDTPTPTATSTGAPTSTPTSTPTFTPTATPTFTPTPTNTPIPDTSPPVVDIIHYPTSPTTDDVVYLTANASDNVGVVKIEIFFRNVASPIIIPIPVKTCNVPTCQYQTGPLQIGTYEYLARAYDAAGNYTTTPSKYFAVIGAVH